MPYRGHDPHCLDAACEQTEEIGGNDESRHRRREAFDLGTQPDQRPEQSVREKQQAERREQRRDGGEGLAEEHRAALIEDASASRQC